MRMYWLALRVLTGNRGKFFGMIAGTAIASLLISQQVSIFLGIVLQTANQIYDVRHAQIWVMDPNVKFIDDMKRLPNRELHRVRSVSGVEWAVPYAKDYAPVQLPNGDFHQVFLLGVDDVSLAGAPREMVLGESFDLRRPNGILIDEGGYRQLWPTGELATGQTVEIFDKQAVVVGICRSSPTFQSFPIVYTTYSRAIAYASPQYKQLSYILVRARPDTDVEQLAHLITVRTGLKALTKDAFMWMTIEHFLRSTGVLINFALTVSMGFLIGSAVSGQMFYLFTVENLWQFGTLKALGITNGTLIKMLVFQALAVGAIGYGIGIGAAAFFGEFIMGNSRLAYFMWYGVPILTAVAVLLIVAVSSMISLRRVLIVEPALVYRL